MKRGDLIRALRRYAGRRALVFDLMTGKGKGSHYRLRVGDRFTTLQSAAVQIARKTR